MSLFVRCCHQISRDSKDSTHGSTRGLLYFRRHGQLSAKSGKWPMPRHWIAIALFLSLLVSEAYGDPNIYRWRDDQGRLHFTDNPETIPIQYWNQLPQESWKGEPGQETAPQKVRVPLERIQGGVLIPVWINGNNRVPFYLDTGSTYCQITREDARALGLDVEHIPPVKVVMADGRSVETQMVILDALRIGSLEVRRVEALVGDLRLLGLNVLQRFRVTVDLPRGEIMIERPP